MNRPYDPLSETVLPNLASDQRSEKDRGKQASPEFRKRVADSRSGNGEATDNLLAACRNFLMMIADRATQQGLQSKVASIDLVRDTLKDAKHQFERFQGETEEELLRWLTGILESKIGQAQKWYFGQLAIDSNHPMDWFHLFSSNSTQLNANPNGLHPVSLPVDSEPARYFRALAALTLDQQAAIRLRIEERLSFDEIGSRMACTAETARLLFLQAVHSLPQQDVMSQDEKQSPSLSRAAAR